jgi:hypothetical protein
MGNLFGSAAITAFIYFLGYAGFYMGFYAPLAERPVAVEPPQAILAYATGNEGSFSRLDFVALEQVFRDNRQTKMQAFLQPYLNSWTALKGTVSDIASSHDEIIAVTLEGPVASPIAFMAFDEGQRLALGSTNKGDQIEAFCRIGRIDPFRVLLQSCILFWPETIDGPMETMAAHNNKILHPKLRRKPARDLRAIPADSI